MTFWWKCNDGGSTAPTGPDFNSDLVENLVGLWEFSSGGETKDTGLSDGIAQNGHFHGNAHAANGALQLDGNCDYFDVSGTDAPFDLSEGTVQVQFIQDHQVGTSPDTIVNRGEFCDKDTEGYFNIQVTANGAVTVSHLSGSESLSLSTGAGFFDEGDELRVSYSWDDDGQGSFVVENLSEGTTYETDFDSAGLNMDIGDNDDENFTFGAREYDDGTYDQYFDGSIAYVAVFSDPSITTGSDGIVEGTDGDDIIDATYEGDPDGDMIDAGDARLAGEVGDDDIIYAGAGDDTILAGAGNDEIYGQGGNDTIDAGTGDDVIYGDASSGSTKVFTGDYVRESFEWNEAGVADDQALTDFTQDTGNVNVSFKVVQQDADAQTQFSSDQQKVHSIETDGPEADAHSSLDSNLNGHGNEATYELSFSDAVNDVSFRVNDIDGDGLVKITAYDAAGNEINVDMTGGSHLTLKDTDGQFGVDTADSNGGYEEDTSPNYSLLVDIPGPVARIVIEHDQNGSNNSGINITDVYYDAPVIIEGEADDCADAGDDVISAGDGDDLVFGNGGDDTIDGGAGDDTLYGDGQNDGQSSGGNVADSLSLNANNVQYGSQTGHDGSAGAGDSVIYNNVAVTEDGTVVMAKLVVVDVDSGLKVDLTGGLGSEILLNGDNDNSDAGKDATFRLEFYDQATGEPIALTSVATFGDLDLTNTAEKVTISTDTFSNYGTSADTSLNVTTGAGTVTATGTEENDPTDQDAWFSAGFENETAIEFTLTTRDVNSGFTLNGQLIDAPVVVEICEPGDDIITGGEGDDVIYGDDGTFGQLSADNLIVNGSFEDTSGMTQTGYGYTDTGAVNGWTSSNPTTNDIDFHNDGRGDVDPTDGNNWLDLEGNPGPLRIGQDVNGVQDGEEYVLTFDAADAVGGDNGIKVFWNGELIDTIDPNEGDMTTYTYTVVGGSGDGSDRLEFEGTGQVDYVGASIDNVSLVGYDSNDGEGGDDIITGGSGSDTMYGEGGNDIFLVGSGAEGDGDVITGGNGPDENTDIDVLDLRGAGKVTIVSSTDGSDSGALAGTVTFEDGETLTFSQIEQILTDPQNEGPEANDDTASTDEDTPVTINVLGNDTDPDGDDLTVSEATSPNGTVTINPDGTITFTPDENFNGDTTITYTITDPSGETSTATVDVTVAAVDELEAVDDTAQTDEDTPVTIDVIANDENVDGGDPTIIAATVPAAQGTVEIVNNQLVFTPAENFNGEATITYTIQDEDGLQDTATVDVTVTPVNDAPDAVDDADTTDEDTAITVDLLANDSDVDGDDLTVVSASVPAEQGTLVDNGDGTVTFTPAPDFNGEATITYTIEDEEGLQDTAVHTITVTPENDAPVAEDDTASTDEDTPVTINVLGNDTDPDGDDLTVSEATSPNGTVTINPDGTLTFTPDENFNGEAVITYTVTDPDGNEDTATVTVDVAPINDAPDAVDDADTTDEDTAITVDLLANDSDVDGDDLTVVSASVPAEQGTLVDNGDGTVTFTPAPDFNGEATITYTIEDEEGLQDTAVHTITVTPENDAPVAEDDTASTDEDTPVTINVLGNDTDPDGDDLTVSEATSPNGTVTINPDGTLTFTPDENFNGEAVITYTVTDPDGNEDTATVTVDVAPINDAPDAVDDADTTDEDTAITVDLLANDSDVDGDDLTVVSASVPAEQGTLVDNGDGTVTFTPAPDFNGEATITYTIEDEEGLQDTAVHTITVTPENDAPVAEDDTASTDEDTPVTINVLGNDTDPDGDDLTVSEATSPNGTVTINPDGTLTFTPDENFNGEAVITYTVTDPDGNEDTATVTVDVAPINDAPDAVDDADTTDEDTAITVDLLANDSDVDGDDLTVVSASVPAEQGTLVDNGDGTVTFTPAPDFNGEATITYTIEDEEGLQDTAVHTITVTPENDAPVAEDDTASTDEDTPVTINVLGNDTDPDGDDLTVSEATSPNGTVTINPDGTLTFTPDENFNGEAVITYTVTDPDGNEDTATVTVDVAPINDAPDAVDDADTTDEDTAITVDLLANDSDVDGDDLTVVSASVPAEQGTLVDNGDGTVTFTPAPDFNGEATITYTIEDEEGLQDTAVHTITVVGVNEDPEAEDDCTFTNEDTPVTVNLLANDTDPDGDPLTVVSAVLTDGEGTLIDNGDGTVTFEPSPDWNGVAVVTYTVDDGNGGTDTAEHLIAVRPINDAPEAVDDTAETDFNAPVIIDVLDNDTDVDGDDLTVIAATSPDGTVEINPDGTLTFTPTDGFTGEATIDYTIEDEDGLQDTAQVSVTVGDQPRDGIVEGTSGDDLIDLAYTGDPDGDMIDNNDELLAGEGPNDDIIFGYDGDDTILGGEGDDEIDGGTGDDTIFGEDGDDVIVDEQGSDTVDGGDGDDEIDVAGGDSPDTIAELLGLTNPNNLADLDYSPYSEVVPVDSDPNDDIDTVIGGAGDDTIITGDDADYIEGGDGDDTIYSGIDDDTVFGGDGDDYIEDVQGADYVDGGAGDDTIIVGFDTFSDYSNGGLSDDPKLPSAGYPFLEDQNQIDGKDEVHGGDGDDYIVTGDDADLIYGDDGDDTIKAGIDDDTVYGGAGNDNILGGHGSDYIEGGDGDDYIDASDLFQIMNHTNEDDATDPFPNNDMDTVYGGAGNDTIIGGDDQDMLYGEDGNDIIDGGIDDDTIDGGAGNDILMGGDGDDTITAGEGFDTVSGGTGSDSIYGGGDNDVLSGGDDNDFIYISESQSGQNNTTVNGGAGGLDWDTLDISDMLSNGWVITTQVQNPDSDGNGFDGQIQLYNADDDTYANINYTNIEQVIPCFTPGTMIATPEGERAVESLKVGDKVITRDNGMQTIRWVGAKEMTTDELTKRAELKPILIREGALGQGLPERDMIVSPNHRMLVTSEKAALLFEDYEVLVAAKHLLGREGVEELDAQDVTYIHIMFDRHEVILSDGTWSESFQPGDYTLAGIGEESRTEIFTLFPELRDIATREDYVTARRVLRKHEAALLVN